MTDYVSSSLDRKKWPVRYGVVHRIDFCSDKGRKYDEERMK